MRFFKKTIGKFTLIVMITFFSLVSFVSIYALIYGTDQGYANKTKAEVVDDIYCDYWSTDECDMEDKLQACKLNAEGASSWRDRVVIGRSLRTDQLPIRAVFIP